MSAAAAVRVAGPADLDALVALRDAWTRERHPAGIDDGFADRFRDWFAVERHQRTFWLAEVAAQPVGMVNLVTFTRMPVPGREAGRWGYLGNMFVLDEHRGVGIGRQLLDALLAHADREDLERVVLSPTERSVPFYRRAGFDHANELLLRPRP